MCYRPLHISNHCRHHIPGVDKDKLTVPCGHCWQCVENARKGFAVRAYFEYQRCKSKGYALFYTLTYDPDHLPTVTPLKLPCFNHEDVKKYIKKVRSRMTYYATNKLNWTKDQVSLRYLITSEYGSLKGRPHYHALFFVNCPFPRADFLDIVKDCWDNGISKGSSINRGFIDDNGFLPISAILYVTKYCTKDTVTSAKVAKTRQIINDAIVNPDSIIKLSKQDLDDFEHTLPRTFCSKYFGMNILTELGLTSDNLAQFFVDNKIVLPDKKCGTKVYPVPEYYKRNLLYYYKTEKIEYVHHSFPDVTVTKYDVQRFPNEINHQVKVLSYSASLSHFRDNVLRNLASLTTYDFKKFGDFTKTRLGYSSLDVFNYNDVLDVRSHLMHLTDSLSDDFLKYATFYCQYNDYLQDVNTYLPTLGNYDHDQQFVSHINKDLPYDFDPLTGCLFDDMQLSMLHNVHNFKRYSHNYDIALLLLHSIQHFIGIQRDFRFSKLELSKKERDFVFYDL